MKKEIQLKKLSEFIERDKFSEEKWSERGLNSSNDELCKYLSSFFNVSAEQIIIEVNKGSSDKRLISVLKSSFSSMNDQDYDTEEKEFIGDLFHELASIVDVSFHDNINMWLYESLVTSLVKPTEISNPPKDVETLQQACTKCNTSLETYILKRENGLPETGWLVGKCNHCGTLNLIIVGPNVKEIKFGNYQWVDSLSTDEYSYQQALTRLEQIK